VNVREGRGNDLPGKDVEDVRKMVVLTEESRGRLPVVAENLASIGCHSEPPGLARDARIDGPHTAVGQADLDATGSVGCGQTEVAGRIHTGVGGRHLKLCRRPCDVTRGGGTVTPIIDHRHPFIPGTGIGIRGNVVKRTSISRPVGAWIGFADSNPCRVQDRVGGAIGDVQDATDSVDLEAWGINKAPHRLEVGHISRDAVDSPAGIVVGAIAVGRVSGVDENLGRRLIVGDRIVVTASTRPIVHQTTHMILLMMMVGRREGRFRFPNGCKALVDFWAIRVPENVPRCSFDNAHASASFFP